MILYFTTAAQERCRLYTNNVQKFKGKLMLLGLFHNVLSCAYGGITGSFRQISFIAIIINYFSKTSIITINIINIFFFFNSNDYLCEYRNICNYLNWIKLLGYLAEESDC